MSTDFLLGSEYDTMAHLHAQRTNAKSALDCYCAGELANALSTSRHDAAAVLGSLSDEQLCVQLHCTVYERTRQNERNQVIVNCSRMTKLPLFKLNSAQDVLPQVVNFETLWQYAPDLKPCLQQAAKLPATQWKKHADDKSLDISLKPEKYHTLNGKADGTPFSATHVRLHLRTPATPLDTSLLDRAVQALNSATSTFHLSIQSDDHTMDVYATPVQRNSAPVAVSMSGMAEVEGHYCNAPYKLGTTEYLQHAGVELQKAALSIGSIHFRSQILRQILRDRKAAPSADLATLLGKQNGKNLRSKAALSDYLHKLEAAATPAEKKMVPLVKSDAFTLNCLSSKVHSHEFPNGTLYVAEAQVNVKAGTVFHNTKVAINNTFPVWNTTFVYK